MTLNLKEFKLIIISLKLFKKSYFNHKKNINHVKII